LQDKHDIFLNGVMLVSLAVDLQTLSFDSGNELPYIRCSFRPMRLPRRYSQGAVTRAAKEAADRRHQGSGGVRHERLQRGAAPGLTPCAERA
jgi:hypothetical protein